nr:MAG TPA: hypothetical protein [Caudoviricetes sp.]
MRKYTFTEMNIYLSLIDTDTIVSEYNTIVDSVNHEIYANGENDRIYFACNIDVYLEGKTPAEICRMSSSGYFSAGERYYIIDSGNMVSVPVDSVRYFIERHLTFNELFRLCQKLGIERN